MHDLGDDEDNEVNRRSPPRIKEAHDPPGDTACPGAKNHYEGKGQQQPAPTNHLIALRRADPRISSR